MVVRQRLRLTRLASRRVRGFALVLDELDRRVDTLGLGDLGGGLRIAGRQRAPQAHVAALLLARLDELRRACDLAPAGGGARLAPGAPSFGAVASTVGAERRFQRRHLGFELRDAGRALVRQLTYLGVADLAEAHQ